MKPSETVAYRKPTVAKVKVDLREKVLTGPRYERGPWSGESCYKVCRNRNRSDRPDLSERA